MVKCQNCGNLNDPGSNFCRFCGTRVHQPQAEQRFTRPELNQQLPPQPRPQTADPFNLTPPQPYSWKTDEFRTNATARQTVDLPLQNQNAQPLAFRDAHQHLSQPYRCPYCSSQFLPRIERKISTAGWITFALLLVFIFPLFWIGLLIKEDQRYCPSCGMRVG